MTGFGLAQLNLQHAALLVAAGVGVIIVTYAVTWLVALFHRDAGRRAEAQRLLGGHLLYRKLPPGKRTGDDER